MKFDTPHTDSTPDLPFSVSITQNGWGTNLAVFATEAEALAFVEKAWRTDHDHPDFTHGGDLRAEWSVSKDTHDVEGGIVESDRLWSKQADERRNPRGKNR